MPTASQVYEELETTRRLLADRRRSMNWTFSEIAAMESLCEALYTEWRWLIDEEKTTGDANANK